MAPLRIPTGSSLHVATGRVAATCPSGRPHWIDKSPTVETEPMTEINMTQPSLSGKKQLDGRRTARQLSNEDRKTLEREDVNSVGKPFRLLFVLVRDV